MHRPLGIGQIWLLEKMVEQGGAISTLMATWHCPTPVGMSALRGLEKRGLCKAASTLGIFSITDDGRHRYEAEKPRLDHAKAEKRRKELAQIEEEDRAWDAAESSTPESDSTTHGNPKSDKLASCQTDSASRTGK